jgi:hypothetical protein
MKKINELSMICLFLNDIRQISNRHQTDKNYDFTKIIEKREKLRERVNNIWTELDKIIGKHNAHFIIFAIVAYVDEIVSAIFIETNNNWPKLQKEIFDTDAGGEKFYELLDALLIDPSYPKITYYTFYLILKSGFKGELIDRSSKSKQKYLNELEIIIKANIPVNSHGEDLFIGQPFSWKYYLSKYYLFVNVCILIFAYFSSVMLLKMI